MSNSNAHTRLTKLEEEQRSKHAVWLRSLSDEALAAHVAELEAEQSLAVRAAGQAWVASLTDSQLGQVIEGRVPSHLNAEQVCYLR